MNFGHVVGTQLGIEKHVLRTLGTRCRYTTKCRDGHSALQGGHVVRPLTVANYLPLDTTRMPYYTSPTRVHEVFRHIVASIRSYGSTGPRARCNLFR